MTGILPTLFVKVTLKESLIRNGIFKMSKNNCIRGISENGGVAFCGVDATQMVCDMEKLHETSAVVSAALGRLLIAAGMMGVMMKHNDDSITLKIKGDGPIGTLCAVSNGKGETKGYVANSVVELPLRQDGKLNVGMAVGKEGMLSVVRDLGLKEPYIGQVPLVSGEIGDDITSYYAKSEQMPTVCGLGVLVSEDLSIESAGGFLIQLLPGATEEEITMLEQNIKNLQSVTNLLKEGKTPYDIMHIALKGFNPEVLDEQNICYNCNCSYDKVEKIVLSLGKDEIKNMIEEKEDAEVICHFCNKKYSVFLPDLMK